MWLYVFIEIIEKMHPQGVLVTLYTTNVGLMGVGAANIKINCSDTDIKLFLITSVSHFSTSLAIRRI